jgi:IS30 family transposase
MVKVAKLDSVKRGSIQALRESGMSYAQIANQLEISKDTVFRWVKRAASDPSRPTSSLHIGNKHAKKNSKKTDSFLYRIVIYGIELWCSERACKKLVISVYLYD